MTLILKFDLDMVKKYLHTNNEVSSYNSSKTIAWIDRHTQTGKSDWTYYLPTYAEGDDQGNLSDPLVKLRLNENTFGCSINMHYARVYFTHAPQEFFVYFTHAPQEFLKVHVILVHRKHKFVVDK